MNQWTRPQSLANIYIGNLGMLLLKIKTFRLQVGQSVLSPRVNVVNYKDKFPDICNVREEDVASLGQGGCVYLLWWMLQCSFDTTKINLTA